MKTVATLLAEHLKKFGINHVFGIPGRAIAPIIFEVDKQGIQYVLCRHECGAGFAASGYSLMNKKLGVAIGTSGPGGMNMLTAAGQAKALNLPVLFITGHPSMAQTGRAQGQDSSFFGTDLVKMFEPVTLFSTRVERGELLPLYLRHALEKAHSGAKGPVHLNIPMDVLMEKIESFEIEFPQIMPLISTEIENIASSIEKAKSPLMFLGKGVNVAGAYEEVQILSERLQIPVITSPGGKGTFPNQHIHYLGTFGLGGSEQATAILNDGVDLMIIVGNDISDMSAAGMSSKLYPKHVIQFDYDITFVGKSIPVPTIPVIGDIKENLRRVLEKVSVKHSQMSLRSMRLSSTTSSSDDEQLKLLTACKAFKVLRKCLPRDTIVFGDAGSNTFHAIKNFDIPEPGTFYFDENFITMGHGIGYAIGAKFARPDSRIVCITGDGCTFMHGTEISTAVCNGIPVIFIVINNGRLDMVEKAMKYNIGYVVGGVFERPLDVAMFARSLGASAFCCHSESDIEDAIEVALSNQGPSVLEIIVDPEEIPPTLSREGK